jgi:hypothetical protein
MKGQITPITAILLTGVVVALLGVAYFWGTPLIEKRGIITEFETMESFTLRLDDAISDVSNNRAGSKTISIPIGSVQVIPETHTSEQNNSIIVEFVVNQQMLFEDSLVPIETTNLAETGTFGVDKPRTITLTSERFDGRFKLKFDIHYRTLFTQQEKGYRISLNSGAPGPISGTQDITVAYEGIRSEDGVDITDISISLL